MVDRINPNRKNRLSPKDILKRSAALTLLLSTVACSSDGGLSAALPGAGIFLIYLIYITVESKERWKRAREERKEKGPWEPTGDGDDYGKH